MQLVRRLWTREHVDFEGRFFRVKDSTCLPRPAQPGGLPLYFGGASPAAEEVAAAEADVQLMWGESLAMAAERIDRLQRLSAARDREEPLAFGLRITVVARESSDDAWHDAEAKLAGWEGKLDRRIEANYTGRGSVGQARLRQMTAQGEVVDRCLWTRPATVGTGAATTWLVGSFDEVAASLRDYAALGIDHFILSDTPYREEAIRLGDGLLPRLATLATGPR
jgi:alkanesulfonate monooxygenase